MHGLFYPTHITSMKYFLVIQRRQGSFAKQPTANFVSAKISLCRSAKIRFPKQISLMMFQNKSSLLKTKFLIIQFFFSSLIDPIVFFEMKSIQLDGIMLNAQIRMACGQYGAIMFLAPT